MSAPTQVRDPRNGLRTSATLATVFTLLGHTVLGFEQSWAQVVVALAAGYSCALFFEWVDARANGLRPGFAGGGWHRLVDFLLSAHMTSITLSFLLYVNRRLWIMALAVALAIGSKYVFRVYQDGKLRHFMNPSNFAIAVLLATYRWTGALPWAFTVKIHGFYDLLVPLVIVGLGFRLNLFFTGRLPTIAAWLVTFIVLGIGRAWYQGTPIFAQLVPLTGVAMVLFTFYMITDPQTSPSRRSSQLLFGGGIAVAYSVLLLLHIQYMMFYSVTVVAGIRGLWLLALSLREPAVKPAAVPATAPSF
ncbi:MAG TPA: enediyne biosynthesis protein UnbU [Thermoanaerobaculia bacterium]|nr:enediyne biosynthesis protein UnbU [Thermoanaerobaculia bacterium]